MKFINALVVKLVDTKDLKSAAAKTAMQSVQGPVIELSEERIIFIINNIAESFDRIDKLLSVEWKD